MCSLLLSYNDLRRRRKPIGGEHAVCLSTGGVHYNRKWVGGAVYITIDKKKHDFNGSEKGYWDKWLCSAFKIMFDRK